MLSLLFASVSQQVAVPVAGPYELEFVEVAPGVVVAHRPDPLRDPVSGNVTILINDRDVVLVDAGGAPRAAEQILDEVRRRTHRPISTLVLTHGHEDHVLGTQVFEHAFPGLRVISREGTRDYLAPDGPVDRRRRARSGRIEQTRAEGQNELDRLRADGAHRDVLQHLERRWGPDLAAMGAEHARARLHQPDEVFWGRLEIVHGSRTIQLLDLGPGKSGSATVVYLPRERIVIAGDVVVSPIPYGFARDPEGWRQTLLAVAALDARLLIPGHGLPQTGSHYVQRLAALSEFIINRVAIGVTEGVGVDAIIERSDFEPWVREFGNGDPLREYYFRQWMIEPAVSLAFAARVPG